MSVYTEILKLKRQLKELKRLVCPCTTPVVSIDSVYSEICEGGSVTIGTLTEGCYTYQWQESIASVWTDIPGETGKTITISNITEGVHVYRLVVFDRGCVGFSNEYTVTGTANLLDVYVLGDLGSVCIGGSILCTSELYWNGAPIADPENAQYQWQYSTDDVVYTDIPGATFATYTTEPALVEGVFFYRLVATYGMCTSESAAGALPLLVGSDPTLNIQIADTDTICVGGSTMIVTEAVGGSGGNNYQWQILVDGVWTDIEGETGSQINATQLVPGVYSYRVTVTQDSGCYAESAAVGVTVEEVPSTTITADDETIAAGGTFTLSGFAIGGPVPFTYQWEWFDGGVWTGIFGANSDTFTNAGNPTFDPIAPGTYDFRLYTTSYSGCDSISNTVTITVT